MQENKYTEEFFKEYEEKYIPKNTPKNSSRKKGKNKSYKFPIILISLLFVVLFVFLIIPKDAPQPPKVDNSAPNSQQVRPVITENPYKELSEFTVHLSSEVNSEYAILINADTGEILAEKNYSQKMYPASLTKIMTLLVALDNTEKLTDTYEMSYKIIDPPYRQGASMAGFSSGEKVRIIDMLYGLILPSGADAAGGLADYVSGSEKSFIELMNKKCKSLGLKNTSFANCSGLFDEQNYTTAHDMALILKELIKNEIAVQILSKSEYTTSSTPQHPEGLWMDSTISHYIRGNEPTNETKILGGKTGFVSQSGYCIASFAKSKTGNNYILVTGKAESGKKAAKDHIAIYSSYAN